MNSREPQFVWQRAARAEWFTYFRVIRHTRKQAGYPPDAEDWFWYVAFPLAAYATLFVAAALLASHPQTLLFVVAGALGLLFMGIHNAWDTVTYITLRRAQRRDQQSQE